MATPPFSRYTDDHPSAHGSEHNDNGPHDAEIRHFAPRNMWCRYKIKLGQRIQRLLSHEPQSPSSSPKHSSGQISSTKDLETSASTQYISTEKENAVGQSMQAPTKPNNQTQDWAAPPNANASVAAPRPLSSTSLRAMLQRVSTEGLRRTLETEPDGSWTAPKGFKSVPQPGLDSNNQEAFIQQMLVYRENENDPEKLETRFGLIDPGSPVSIVCASKLEELRLGFYRIPQDAIKGIADELVTPMGLKPLLWCDEGDKNSPPTNWVTTFVVIPDPANDHPQFDFLLGADFCSAAKLKLERPPAEKSTLSFLALRSQHSVRMQVPLRRSIATSQASED